MQRRLVRSYFNQVLSNYSSAVFQAVMFVHDQVAERNFKTSLQDIPREVDEDDDAAVKIIQLVKSFAEPLVRIFTYLNSSTL